MGGDGACKFPDHLSADASLSSSIDGHQSTYHGIYGGEGGGGEVMAVRDGGRHMETQWPIICGDEQF